MVKMPAALKPKLVSNLSDPKPLDIEELKRQMHLEAKYGLIIGRFQPFHNAHKRLLDHALEKCDNVIVLVGSYKSARTTRNPFTFNDRKTMIEHAVNYSDQQRVIIQPVRDHLYNDNLWIAEVQRIVGEITNGSNPKMYGHEKDVSSYYLNLFPQWKFGEIGEYEKGLSGSDIRNAYFGQDTGQIAEALISASVPHVVKMYMDAFRKTPEFEALKKEYEFIKSYHDAWKNSPFPPMFVTVDSIVIKSGHILVVRRRGIPGKGRIALPGGYLQQNELIVDGAMRELKEETGITITKQALKESITAEKVFDHPLRSQRGRTITHAFCIDLGSGQLPKVKGMDDADKAWWMPLHEVYEKEDQFFDDHFHIISHFINKF